MLQWEGCTRNSLTQPFSSCAVCNSDLSIMHRQPNNIVHSRFGHCRCSGECDQNRISRLRHRILYSFFHNGNLSTVAKTGLSAAFYRVVMECSHRVLLKLTHYETCAAPQKHRILLYVLSLINATGQTGFSLVKVWIRSNREFIVQILSKSVDINTGTENQVHMLTGYLVHDFLASHRTWSSHLDDFVHHLLGVGIIFAALNYSREYVKEYPYFVCLELSTVFMALSWLVREFHPDRYQDNIVFRTSSKLFVATFFGLRVFWFGFRVWKFARQDKTLHKSTLVLLVAVYCLQLFWAGRIIQMLRAQ